MQSPSRAQFVLFAALILAWVFDLAGCSRGHGARSGRLTVTVGLHDADVTGSDNRAIQLAIDRVAAAGGGTVVIKPGAYTLYNSVRLASHVTLEGEGPEQTLLEKGPGVMSPLTDDANFGEYQAMVEQASGFAPGMGVAVISKEFPGDIATPRQREDQTRGPLTSASIWRRMSTTLHAARTSSRERSLLSRINRAASTIVCSEDRTKCKIIRMVQASPASSFPPTEGNSLRVQSVFSTTSSLNRRVPVQTLHE